MIDNTAARRTYAALPSGAEWAPVDTFTVHGPARTAFELCQVVSVMDDVTIYKIVAEMIFDNPQFAERMIARATVTR